MKWKPILVIILFAIFLLTFSIAIKIYLNAELEYKRANTLFAQNKLAEAMTHYERSIQWFLPGLSLQNRAAEGLWNVGEKYEANGDTENALAAYRLLRGAFYSARSFYTPGKTWIDRCNEKIATLMAGQSASSGAEKAKTFAERRAENLKILSADKSPRNQWAVLAVIGFFGWIACALLFVVKAISKTGKVSARPAIAWIAGFIVFYGLWILGLLNT